MPPGRFGAQLGIGKPPARHRPAAGGIQISDRAGHDQMFRKFLILAAALATFATAPGITAAQDGLLGSYVARISQADHYASDGYRLDTAAQMVRQDRANVHRFGRIDAEDDDDPWFRTADARARMERLLNRRGSMDQATRQAIARGEPVVRVDVYRNSLRVSVLGY